MNLLRVQWLSLKGWVQARESNEFTSCLRSRMIFERHRTSTTRDGNKTTVSIHCFSAIEADALKSLHTVSHIGITHTLSVVREDSRQTSSDCIFFLIDEEINHSYKSSFIRIFMNLISFHFRHVLKISLYIRTVIACHWRACFFFNHSIN